MIVDNPRRTGATQFLIDELVDSIALGQPKSIVWCHSRKYTPQIKTRVIEALEARGLPLDLIEKDMIMCAGSEIRFMSEGQNTRGLHGYGDFIDHYALESEWFQTKFLQNNEWSDR